MHRVLAVLIALLLGAGVVTAVVKDGDDDTVPLVEPTSSPTQTFTFDGPAPTESMFTETASPFEPGTEEPTGEPTTEPTETMTELPRTGAWSLAPVALLTLALAIGAGLAAGRGARGSS